MLGQFGHLDQEEQGRQDLPQDHEKIPPQRIQGNH